MTIRNLLEKCKNTNRLEIALKEEGQENKKVMCCDIEYWKALNENILDCTSCLKFFNIRLNLERLEIIYRPEKSTLKNT